MHIFQTVDSMEPEEKRKGYQYYDIRVGNMKYLHAFILNVKSMYS